MESLKFSSVDEYISTFPKETAALLKEFRQLIRKAAPKAEEVISYNMPAYKLNGMLVYFAGFKNHVSLFPAGSAIEPFKAELSIYKTSKGTIQFPLDKKLPAALITRIVKYRIKENELKKSLRPKKK